MYVIFLVVNIKTPWRNGSASDSRSEGCVFESRRAHTFVPAKNGILAMLKVASFNQGQKGKR